jgi:hypothetical protein
MRVWFNFKNEYLKSINIQVPPELIQDLYQKDLKTTREFVYKYFGLKNTQEIDVKYLIRLYPFTFEPSHPLLNEYIESSKTINILLQNMQNYIIPTAFILERNENIEDHIQNVTQILNFRL